MKAIRKHRNGRAARASFARTLVVAFAAFAFILQSIAIQTHIHQSGGSGVSWTFGIAEKSLPGAAQAGKASSPVQDDLKHCPFCDAMAYAGAYLASAPTLLLLPSQTFSVIPLEFAVPAYVDAASHFWRGRAPPRV